MLGACDVDSHAIAAAKRAARTLHYRRLQDNCSELDFDASPESDVVFPGKRERSGKQYLQPLYFTLHGLHPQTANIAHSPSFAETGGILHCVRIPRRLSRNHAK
jgi:hypothetical protein